MIFLINKCVCGVEFAPITARSRWLNVIRCYVPCHWRSLSPVHLWLGYWWQQSPHWFCWFGTRMLWTHPDPLCRKKLETGKRKWILLPVLAVSEQGLIQMTFVVCQRLLFTCFQESSPIKISSCLRHIKATSYHMTGRGHGHVQVKIFRDRLRATWKKIIYLRGK